MALLTNLANFRIHCFRIQKMRINAKEHMAQTRDSGDRENTLFEVQICPKLQILRCGGIEIFGKPNKKKSSTKQKS